MTGSRQEGGKHAIKGFLYQFDKTIIEVLENPAKTILFEQDEDIQYDGYYMQIKHRECSKYYPSSISKPTFELIKLFEEDHSRKFCLFCYFKDQTPRTFKPTKEELNVILESYIKNDEVTCEAITSFVNNYKIVFAINFEQNFKNVIKLISEKFDITEDLVSIIQHSIIRSHLLDLSIKSIDQRAVSFDNIKALISSTEKNITLYGYQNIIGEQKYIKLIKKSYFVQRTANINNFERLFIIECDDSISNIDLMHLIKNVGNKYSIKAKSPQPFILLRNIDNDKLIVIKKALIDTDFFFNDGTYFDGDDVRVDKLFKKEDNIKVRC